MSAADEIKRGARFGFGGNWRTFLEHLDEGRIRHAEKSLQDSLRMRSLDKLRFLDIGSGSGLFSLAAHRLGATVSSFDFDPQSVECTQEVKRRHGTDRCPWQVSEGSVLDEPFVRSLGIFDIVYSWGVLHHTGNMWKAIENATLPVSSGGRLFIAIYNDEGRASRTWLRVKKLYNALPVPLRPLVLAPAALRLWGPTMVRDLLHGHPFKEWREYGARRGMSPWVDVVDWVGGLPFEVARPEEVFDFVAERGFTLRHLQTTGLNEFVFLRA